MALTKKAKKDFQKIFKKKFKEEDIPNIKKSRINNKYSERKRNRKKDLKRDYKNKGGYYSKEVTKKEVISENLVEVNTYTESHLLTQSSYRFGRRAKFFPLKGNNKQLYQIVHAPQRSTQHYDYWDYISKFKTNGYYETEVFQTVYKTIIKSDYKNLDIFSNYPIFQEDGKYSISEVIDRISKSFNNKKLEIISWELSFSNRRIDTKSSELLEEVQNLNKLVKYISNYKHNPKYKRKELNIINQLDKEINLYSGMNRESKKKTKYRQLEKHIIKSYNNLSNDLFFDYEDEEIFYGKPKTDRLLWTSFICDCDDCRFSSSPIIDGNLTVYYEAIDYIEDFERYSEDYKNSYESWDYKY